MNTLWKWPHWGLCIIGLFSFVACRNSPKAIRSNNFGCTQIDSTISPKPAMEAMLAPYRLHMDSVMNDTVGYTTLPLSKAQPECTAGNFIADAQLWFAKQKNPKVQLSVMNYGGIRTPYISPGALTRGKIYELMPFDNKLSVVEIPGNVLHVFCDKMAASGGWPIAGFSYRIKNKKAVDILVEGKEINPNFVYYTALSDYIANGGDNCPFLLECKRVNYNAFVRDMMIGYLEMLKNQHQPLNVKLEKRVSYAE
ncbi:MAG: 5'-nucleotidase [Edaphocola sp.]